MEKVRALGKRLLYPPRWLLLTLPVASFAALACLFAARRDESAVAYAVYLLSAYSLTIVLAALPKAASRAKAWVLRRKAVQKLMRAPHVVRYREEALYRAGVALLQGLAVNALYMLFHLASAIRYASVWFLSMSAYELVLCVLRADLARSYRKRQAGGAAFELRCYRRAALSLLALNVPMGGMIVLMVLTESGYSYPGYMIYVSALYTFYSVAISIADVLRFRNCGSAIISAAKALRFVCAMMSLLGLQTAMIAQFSPDAPQYRRTMNAITGGFVFFAVIATSILMLCRAAKEREKVCLSGQDEEQIL